VDIKINNMKPNYVAGLVIVILFFVAIFVGTTSSCSNKAPEQQTERIIAIVKSPTGWAEMRGAPTKKSLLMMQICNYVCVEVIGYSGEWVKVKANGRTGYIDNGLLRYP